MVGFLIHTNTGSNMGSNMAGKVQRIIRHLLFTNRRLRGAFSRASLANIEQAIRLSETRHCGEIRFAVEGALDGAPLFKAQSARERALDLFSQLRIWDTENNNGVLIYVLLADRAVEIVADRGIHARVGAETWQAICRQIEQAFAQADYPGGVVKGIEAATQVLSQHFPLQGQRNNELPDTPLVLA
jgi:TPM domain